MNYVASELRGIRKEVTRLNRRLAMTEMSGVVAERNADTRKVRLELGEDPDTGEKILSPWVRVQSGSAGAFKTFVLPSVGEQMTLHSASGVIGADSVARFGTFTDENKHPQGQGADEAVLFENGDARLSAKSGEMKLKIGGTEHLFNGQGLTMTGGKIKHDGRNIGSDHKHGGVQSGGSKTADPE